uniref:Metalloendopeptidase n=1 Tax=Strongyloides venezuelensis TaxID=75913 RepID=A0A0K0FEC9_STRVS
MNYFNKIIFSISTLILLTKLITSLSDKQLRSKRSGIRTDAELIKYPIYWCVLLKNVQTTYKRRRAINITVAQQAITQLESRTCLKFIQLTPCKETSYFDKPLIYFENNLETLVDNYNFTYYSKVPNPYNITIERSCNRYVGCFVKKIMAYLGFFLTHKRDDRDNFIDVNESNIIENYKYIYEVQKTNFDLANISYDYGSVMHVTKYFGKNYTLGDTFNTKFSSYYELMTGQQYGLSFTDYKFINYRYCKNECFNTLTCERGGFLNPDSCKYCECPNGFAGSQCERLDNSTSGCGQNHLNASTQLSTLIFSGIEKCNILITAKIGMIIKINVTLAYLPTFNPCFEKQALEIKHRRDKSLTGLCLCTYASNITIESEDHEVLIQYNGEQKHNNATIEYQAVISQKMEPF